MSERWIFGNPLLEERLIRPLEAADPNVRLYVYRLHNGRPIMPATLNGAPFPTLLETLRDEFGGGDFKLMIRRGKVMLLSGSIAIGVPRTFREGTR